MRILDDESDKKLDSITLLFTKAELQQLIGYAKQLIEKPTNDHHHLSSEDYQTEVTICIYDPEVLDNFNSRVQRLIREDL